jgi:hypothetical protein
MTEPAPSWTKPVIEISAAGLGAAVAGPLGGAIGGWLGAALGQSANQLLKRAGEKFGEAATEKLLDTGAQSLLDSLKEAPANLESLYRDSLRLSLENIRTHLDPSFNDDLSWFANWDTCLAASLPLALPALQPGELVPGNLDNLFHLTLQRLDAQGNAISQKSVSLNLATRSLPEPLLAVLDLQLPKLLNETFAALIVTPAYEQAWKETSLKFESITEKMLRSLKEDSGQILSEMSVLKAKLEAQGTDLEAIRNSAAASAIKDQLLLTTQKQLLQEMASKEDWHQKYLELLAQSGPTLQDFLARGDLAGAAQYSREKIEREKAAQAQNYFDYGRVQELQFHFSGALDAYHEAWKINRIPEYGFHYAHMAQFQNRFSEAVGVYEVLVNLYQDPNKVAIVLNNLAGVYRSMHQVEKAEAAYSKALSIRREMAKADPDSQSRDIAAVLNNLGVIYAESKRSKEAEAALLEALTIRRNLVQSNLAGDYSDLASTLNNLGSFVYLGPGRRKDADQAFAEALRIRRDLAKVSPELYLPSVALTLMNIAKFCKTVGRRENAESAYREALSIRTKLAKENPEAYNVAVARTLNALGDFLREERRNQDAELSYIGALNIRRQLAEADSQMYLPQVAETLNSLAYLYHVNQLCTDAEPLYLEELSIYQLLDQTSPGRFRASVAVTQNFLGVLYADMKRNNDAEKAYLDALSIRRSLAAADPRKYSEAVAETLNNMAAFYSDINRVADAKACCDEAEQLLAPLLGANPESCSELLAKVLWTRALLSNALGETAAEACGIARRALAAAATPGTREGLQSLIEALCGKAPAAPEKTEPPDPTEPK